jgi:hypothetical protein
LEELRAARRQQEQVVEPLGLWKTADHLFLELREVAAGDDCDFCDTQQVRKELRHLGIQRGFALGERAVEIEDDEPFHAGRGILAIR